MLPNLFNQTYILRTSLLTVTKKFESSIILFKNLHSVFTKKKKRKKKKKERKKNVDPVQTQQNAISDHCVHCLPQIF